MTSSVDTPERSADPRPEAERQLAAAVARHREVLASMQETGRPEAGQHVAVKAVGRAVHLISFALRHAVLQLSRPGSQMRIRIAPPFRLYASAPRRRPP